MEINIEIFLLDDIINVLNLKFLESNSYERSISNWLYKKKTKL